MVRKQKRTPFQAVKALVRRVAVIAGALVLTLAFFLVLPLMKTLTQKSTNDLLLSSVDTAQLEPPPPPPAEPEQEEEPEEEEKPPELEEQEAPPLDLDQLSAALNPGLGAGALDGDFAAVSLDTFSGQGKSVDSIFSLADLDQQPRVVYQPGPSLTAELKRKAPGTVYIIFIVDERGRVDSPQVQKSTDPIFERAALSAVKQWKFDPGTRNGKPVRFRMRVPVTFPKG